MTCGGIEKSLINFVRLFKDDFDMSLLLLQQEGEMLTQLPKEVKLLKLSTKYQSLTKKPYSLKSKIIRALLRLGFVKLFTKLACDKNFDAGEYDIVLNYSSTNFGSLIALKNTKAKMKITMCHGDPRDLTFVDKAFYRYFDKVLCVSESCKNKLAEIVKYKKDNVDFIYNPNFFDVYERDNQATEDSVLKMITVARVSDMKAPFRLLNVLKRLDAEGFDFQYTWLGNGELMEECKKFVVDNGLEKKVYFKGYDAEPLKQVAKNDLFVLPSKNKEAAPMVYAEAMSVGTPVLTTRLLSAEELVGGKGLICENSEEGLYAALKQVLENKSMLNKYKENLVGYKYPNDLIKQQVAKIVEPTDRKKLCFIMPPSGLPIPAVKGGAIEELLTLFADENEIQQKFDFTFVYKKNDKKSQKEYKFSKFIEIKECKIFQFIKKVINKLSGNRLSNWVTSSYYKKVLKVTDKYYDNVIFENLCPPNAKQFKQKFGKEHMTLHMHNDIKCFDVSENFSKIYCVSNFIKSQWEKVEFKKEIKKEVLFNCINDKKFNKSITEQEKLELERELNINQNDYLLIFCGRLVKEKGVEELLKAISLVNNKNIKLLILGSSFFEGSKKMTPYIQNLKQISNNMQDQVMFTGYVNNDQVYKYYQIADVYVLPSLCEEACSISVLESSASGNYQILTNAGGNKEVSNSNYVTFVEKDDNLVKNLAEAIKYCYENNIKNRGVQPIDGQSVYYERLLKAENNE